MAIPGKNKSPVLLALLLPMFPCAAASFPDYPVRSVGDYPISTVKSGLTIAAYPLDDAKEQGIYLGTKLIRKGYLPVFIVIQNASAGDSFLFRKEAATYRVPGESGSEVSTPEIHSHAGETLEIAGGTLGAAAGIVSAVIGGGDGNPFAPLISIGMIRISNAADVQQNLLKKELQSKTLSPGASTSGFLYVPVRQVPDVRVPKGSARPKISLRIPVTLPGDENAIIFDLVF